MFKNQAMERSKFIFSIDAEKQFTILVRIVASFNRLRIPIIELNSQTKPGEEGLKVTLSVEETKETVLRLSRRLNREIDILGVQVFEEVVSC